MFETFSLEKGYKEETLGILFVTICEISILSIIKTYVLEQKKYCVYAVYTGLQSLTRYDQNTDWQRKLTPEQYVVTREKGTEVVS